MSQRPNFARENSGERGGRSRETESDGKNRPATGIGSQSEGQSRISSSLTRPKRKGGYGKLR